MFLSLHCYISVTALSAKKSDHQYVCHFPVDNNCSCWLSEQTTLSLCCSGLLGDHEVGHAVADHVEPGVSIKNLDKRQEYNNALNILSCLGNKAKLVGVEF